MPHMPQKCLTCHTPKSATFCDIRDIWSTPFFGPTDSAHLVSLSTSPRHRKLTFLFEGHEMRLTDVGGDHDIAAKLVG